MLYDLEIIQPRGKFHFQLLRPFFQLPHRNEETQKQGSERQEDSSEGKKEAT